MPKHRSLLGVDGASDATDSDLYVSTPYALEWRGIFSGIWFSLGLEFLEGGAEVEA